MVLGAENLVILAQVFVIRCRGVEDASVSPASGRGLESAVGQRDGRAKFVAYVVVVCNGRIQEGLGDAVQRGNLAIGAAVCSIHLRLSARRVDFEGVPGKVAQTLVSRGHDAASEQ